MVYQQRNHGVKDYRKKLVQWINKRNGVKENCLLPFSSLVLCKKPLLLAFSFFSFPNFKPELPFQLLLTFPHYCILFSSVVTTPFSKNISLFDYLIIISLGYICPLD